MRERELLRTSVAVVVERGFGDGEQWLSIASATSAAKLPSESREAVGSLPHLFSAHPCAFSPHSL